MTSPMPRDSLGRIWYVGDVTTGGSMVYLAKSDYLRLMSQGSFFNVAADKLTVDLAASPERTNHERYFADLGTLLEIADAADSCLGDELCICERCPLEGWGKAFGARPVGCAYFNWWLDKKAVI